MWVGRESDMVDKMVLVVRGGDGCMYDFGILPTMLLF